MEMWFSTNYTAKVVVEERLHARGQEQVVLERITLNWLRPIVKSLIGIFL